MSDKILFYDSKKYEYEPLVEFSTMCMSNSSSSNRSSLRNVEVKPLYINLYNEEEIIQADIFIDVNNRKDIDMIDSILRTEDVIRVNPDKTIWSLSNIIPNATFPQNKLELYVIDNITKYIYRNKGMVIFSFCAAYKNANVKLQDYIVPDFDFDDFIKIAEYEILTDEEKEDIHNKARQINSIVFTNETKGNGFLSNVFGAKPKKSDDSNLSKSSLVSSLNLTEQEKKIFDPEMLTLSSGIQNSETALNNLIGLNNVKEEVKKLKAKLKYKKAQKNRGIYTDDSSNMHMCFTGNPGTGKTTVARIITGILYDMGYIKENRCIEVNGQNLKGGYQGQTAIITKLVLKSAKNKVLFIDEAYALFDDYQGGYGKEAIAVILKQMEDDRDNTVIIFAGYKNDMETFLLMNDGLKSRINRYIDFKNYSTKELTDIFISMLQRKKLYISELALSKCIKVFKKAAYTRNFSNARFVRNFIEKIEYEHAYNTRNSQNIKRQDTIEIEDVTDECINELLTYSM